MEIAVIVLLMIAMVCTIVRLLRKKERKNVELITILLLGFATVMIILRRFGA
jgi:hypothetical protein